ncbi:MAG: GNAT family N-acetyltransferase [Lachnospiraceae bacterium]|nr:GNAT family N-acetyltransferase [Lachnospiraceae bacterium]
MNECICEVRIAKEKDIDRILELLVQVNMVHHNGRPDIFKGPATKYSREELITIISNSNTPVFVCVDENDYVMGHGFCIKKQVLNDSILTDIKTLYIDDICVAEDSRGKGVGTAIYNHIVMYAKKNNFYNLTLNVWSCNPGAYKFYENMGLVPQKVGMELIL